MAIGEEKVKDLTILYLSQRLNEQLLALGFLLDNAFDRKSEREKQPEGKPMVSNVLDEIINELEIASIHIDEIHARINTKVIPKILLL